MGRPIPTLELWAFFALQARELPTLYPKGHWQRCWKSYQGMEALNVLRYIHRGTTNFSRGTRRTRQNYVMISLPRDKILFQRYSHLLSLTGLDWSSGRGRQQERCARDSGLSLSRPDNAMAWSMDLTLKALPSLSGQSEHWRSVIRTTC